MTTNDALTNPLSAPPPPLDITSLDLFYPTLAWKMAGHAVVGVLVRCRPRQVVQRAHSGAYGHYRLDKRDAQGERAAMVALGGYAALTIAEGMSEPLARGFRGAALCNDWHIALACFPGEASDRQATMTKLLHGVHELLHSEWAKVQAVAAHFNKYWGICGPELGRIVRARPEDLAAAPR
jgi:hypothetical protein